MSRVFLIIFLFINLLQNIECNINERLEKIEERLSILENRAAATPLVRTIPEDGKFVTLEGTPITLKCLAEGNPKPSIKWIRDETLLSENEEFKIKKSTRNYTGSYQCLVDNKVGPMKIKKFDVQILHKPDIKSITPKVKSGPGRTSKLVCESESNPEPKFKWKKDDKEINNSTNKYSIINENLNKTKFETVLNIENIDIKNDFGQYTCQASNKIGDSDASKIIVFGQIPIITKLNTQLYGNSTTKIILKIELFSFATPLKIKLRFKRENEKSWFEKIIDLKPMKNLKIESVYETENGTMYNIEYTMDFLYIDTEFDLKIAFSSILGTSEYKETSLHTAYVCGSELKLRNDWQVLVSHRDFGNGPYPPTGNCVSKLNIGRRENVEVRFTYFNLDDHKYTKKSRYGGFLTEHDSCVNYHHFKTYFFLKHDNYYCMEEKPELGKIFILKSGFIPNYPYLFKFNKDHLPYSGNGFRLEFRRAK